MINFTMHSGTSIKEVNDMNRSAIRAEALSLAIQYASALEPSTASLKTKEAYIKVLASSFVRYIEEG